MLFSVDNRIIYFGGLCVMLYCYNILHILLHITGTISVVYLTEAYLCLVDEESLANDLASLGTLYDVANIIDTPVPQGDVELYYEQTCKRDYRWLQLVNGPGMHSTLCLPPPIGRVCGGSLQAVMVLQKICTHQCKRVLEVGCGQGFCSLFLAQMCPEIDFTGTDILGTHVAIAQSHQEKRGAYRNAEFKVCDATALSSLGSTAKFDLIFGVEALCHLDTPEKRNAFLTQASQCLTENGVVVIIDGFRSATFETCSPNQRKAMQLAERGFRINAMPSKRTWKRHATDLNFTVVQDVDRTLDVIQFWQKGWRVAHFVLSYAFFIEKLGECYSCGKQSAFNFLSIATAAHAFRNRGAAEYGMIVLQKTG